MVKSILNEQFKDLITEETLNALEEAFIQAVEERSKEKVQLETENIAQKLDEKYTEKLQTVIEKIDENHTAKLVKLVEAIDMDHTAKLQTYAKRIAKKHNVVLENLKSEHEQQINEEAQNFQKKLVEEVSNYLDLYIDKTLPTKQIAEAVENVKAANQLKQIRRIVGITEEFIDQEIKEALVDGKKTIDSLRGELNETLKENVELSQRANKAESLIILEKKTHDMPNAKKEFINKLLKNKNPQYIEENFQYVVEMFEKETQTEVDEIKESVKSQFIKTPQVDRPEILEEQQKFNNNEIERDSTSGEGVSGYLNEMKKLGRFSR